MGSLEVLNSKLTQILESMWKIKWKKKTNLKGKKFILEKSQWANANWPPIYGERYGKERNVIIKRGFLFYLLLFENKVYLWG